MNVSDVSVNCQSTTLEYSQWPLLPANWRQEADDSRHAALATRGAARVRWLLACAATGLTPYTEAASTDYWRKPLNLFWMGAGKISA